jgi:hypothetical protein
VRRRSSLGGTARGLISWSPSSRATVGCDSRIASIPSVWSTERFNRLAISWTARECPSTWGSSLAPSISLRSSVRRSADTSPASAGDAATLRGPSCVRVIPHRTLHIPQSSGTTPMQRSSRVRGRLPRQGTLNGSPRGGLPSTGGTYLDSKETAGSLITLGQFRLVFPEFGAQSRRTLRAPGSPRLVKKARLQGGVTHP